MAKKITVELVDDFTGESGATTTRFSLDGKHYEIELVDDRDLRDRMAPWIAKSRIVKKRNGNMVQQPNGRSHRDMHRIRLWARANHYCVPARGKIPPAIIEAFDRDRAAQ